MRHGWWILPIGGVGLFTGCVALTSLLASAKLSANAALNVILITVVGLFLVVTMLTWGKKDGNS